MPALFTQPKIEQAAADNNPPEIQEEEKQVAGLKEKEKRRAANRVATIFTGPGGIVDEQEKEMESLTSVLGGVRKGK